MTTIAAADRSVGERIKWARKRVGLSQERLAAAVGTTRQVVIRWEKGKHLPNALSRERIGRATGQDATFFAEQVDPDDDEDSDPVATELVRALMARLDETIERQVDKAIARAAAKQEPAAHPAQGARDGLQTEGV